MFALILTGCKEDVKTEPSGESNVQAESTNIIKKEPNLVLNFNIKTSEPDEFSIKANDVFLNNNQFMDIKIKQKLNFNELDKNIKFEFPDRTIPDYQLMISLGIKKPKEVEVKYISIEYGDTFFDIPSDKVNDYFTLNKFIEYSPETGIIKTKKVDGQHNPLMFVRRKILDSLSNL